MLHTSQCHGLLLAVMVVLRLLAFLQVIEQSLVHALRPFHSRLLASVLGMEISVSLDHRPVQRCRSLYSGIWIDFQRFVL